MARPTLRLRRLEGFAGAAVLERRTFFGYYEQSLRPWASGSVSSRFSVLFSI